MSFTRSTTNTSVHQGMPDYPSSQGYTTTQLKQAFDAPAEGLQQDLNGLCTELEDTSAAGNIGATPLDAGDSSNGTVQDKLDYIQSELQGIALGSIPDGSITQAKLDSTYEGTIAKKDGTLQTGLSAEMLNGKTEAQLQAAFLTTLTPTELSFSALAKNSGTATETKTVATSGCRYYVLVNEFYKIILYDAKIQKFVFSFPTSSNAYYSEGYAYNTTSIKLYGATGSNNSSITLSATHSSNTLTLSMTKATTSTSGTPGGKIYVFELGGIV